MFIGTNKIISTKNLPENTHEGLPLIQVDYENGSSEVLSKLMYDTVVSEESCDPSAFREKRIFPVVQEVLKIMRNWGLKLNELHFFSAVLTNSLHENQK